MDTAGDIDARCLVELYLLVHGLGEQGPVLRNDAFLLADILDVLQRFADAANLRADADAVLQLCSMFPDLKVRERRDQKPSSLKSHPLCC